jgi:hypothetical protein
MNAQVEVSIKGISPLLMHAYPLVPIEALEKKTPEEQAEYSAYRDPETNDLYLSGSAFQRMLVAAATYSKGKGRGSLQKVVAACVLVSPERASLGTSTYKVDSRPVVIAATKGRVLRHRPRLDSWESKFTIEFDPDLLTESQLRRIVDDGGSRVGMLDYRPSKNGPFGRFMVTSWKVSRNGK